jgi:hypothetical protein
VTVAMPAMLWLGGAAAMVAIALHLLAWRRPQAMVLPTARFVPDESLRVVARSVRPSDLLLLALRVMLISLVALALAGLSWSPRPRGSARVIVADRSRAVADGGEVRDSVLRLFHAGDSLIVFDSVPRGMATGAATPVALAPGQARASISAALVAAARAASTLRRTRDSVEVIVITPAASEELDVATRAIRGAWPGRLRVASVRVAPNDSIAAVEIRAAVDDPLVVSARLAAPLPIRGGARLVRGATTSADSVWVRDAPGRVLIAWPRDGALPAWPSRPADSVNAVYATIGDGTAIVAPFRRAASPPPGGTVVARWIDGEPAATEIALGASCARLVAVEFPLGGDIALAPAARRFIAEMLAPCGGAANFERGSAAWLAADSLGKRGLTARAGMAPTDRGPVPAWLLAAALGLALVELVVRRGGRHDTA